MKAAMLADDDKGKGTKARPSAASGLTSLRFWPRRAKGFLTDVRSETKRVTWPSLAMVRATTIVVLITVFMFGAYFGILDWAFNNLVRLLLQIGS